MTKLSTRSPSQAKATKTSKPLILLIILSPTTLSSPLPAPKPQTTVWTTVTAAPLPPLPQDPNFTSDTSFKQQILDDQNWYRRQHGAESLVWNENLEASSRDWVGKCYFAHSKTPGVGENIAAAYKNVVDSVDAWGLERTTYNYEKPGFAEATGHFTQVVWKGSTYVGCARIDCPPTNKPPNPQSPAWYVVCQYYPPGNVIGEFKENVTPQSNGTLNIGIGGIADGRFTISIPDAESGAKAAWGRQAVAPNFNVVMAGVAVLAARVLGSLTGIL